jgi:hypothetical protein
MKNPVKTPVVSLRDYPTPFAAMLAICSDLDETLSLETYLEIGRFLNTKGPTSYGNGLGLEVGNTIYFDMCPGELSYWSVSEGGRDKLRALMRSGHIDCFHSFGDLSRRSDAARALEELTRHECRLTVWVDHAVAPTNFGADIMHGYGDMKASDAYHADLTWQYGVRFVWLGRVTSVIGQNVKPTLAGVWEREHALASARTIAKELLKQRLGAAGYDKYRMHADNALMRPYELRSGEPVMEFMRCNPHWRGVSGGATGEGLGEVLQPRVFDTLVEKRATCVLYTHLGKGRDRSNPLGERTLAGLQRLAALQDEGKILVTTTAKLLRYHRARDEIAWSVVDDGEQGLRVDVVAELSCSALEGLTFNVPDAQKARLFLNGVNQEIRRFAADSSGSDSISLPWVRATYPLA